MCHYVYNIKNKSCDGDKNIFKQFTENRWLVKIGIVGYNDHSRASESNEVDEDVFLRYKNRVQKTYSFFDLNEAIFFIVN